ncbi:MULTISPECIES: SDR family oxidoreductase [Bacillus]|nr:SDR family oxidoreductase [Bacillus cereus]EEL08489.1 Short chain dehydrogenase [Bacillus cereus BDRD-Cer4]ETT77260.1 Short chain dehydrogenase [Bacillus cereus]KZD85709.1 Short chain dehydrogenase [Bacillus cereus]MCC3288248.1 SDR family oxidoreductase [Bacillus cereus]MEB9997828.1 SDR family oxidoreductase [Bacillus cereus]
MKKVVVITGASDGIGYETAIYLASKGMIVVLSSRNKTKLESVRKKIHTMGGEAIVIPADISKAKEVEQLINKTIELYGRIDVLINNAGVMPLSWLKNFDIREASSAIDVNIKGVLYGIRYVLPHMLTRDEGIIVNIGSTVSYEIPPYGVIYSATKHAVNAITKGLHKELSMSKSKVRLILISPGPVETNLMKNTNAGLKSQTYKTSTFSPVYVAESIYRSLEDRTEPKFSEIITYP